MGLDTSVRQLQQDAYSVTRRYSYRVRDRSRSPLLFSSAFINDRGLYENWINGYALVKTGELERCIQRIYKKGKSQQVENDGHGFVG